MHIHVTAIRIQLYFLRRNYIDRIHKISIKLSVYVIKAISRWSFHFTCGYTLHVCHSYSAIGCLFDDRLPVLLFYVYDSI